MDTLTIYINGEKAVELDGDNILITTHRDTLDSAKQLCESALESIDRRLGVEATA